DTEKREQILCEHCASVREKNSSRSITAGKEVRSTALTVYFSHRGTEDTEKREPILREPCASVREKNSYCSIETGNGISRIPSGFNIGSNTNIKNVRTPRCSGTWNAPVLGTNADGDEVYETRFFTVLRLLRSQEWTAFHFDPFSSQNLLRTGRYFSERGTETERHRIAAV
ncbi:MAG: hypothetical protein ACRCUY_13795, partial [Thermoguttaceae bacterium]